MEIFTGIEQGSSEWLMIRCGLITSSCFDKVMAKGKGSAPSKTRESYLFDLAYERLTGKPVPSGFKSDWMERGSEIEDQARATYELETGQEIKQISFIKMDDYVGASTDGLVNDDGVAELKCPKHNTHMRYLLNPDDLYSDYKKQVQGELFVSGREFVDLISFHPDFKQGKNLLIKRIERDNQFISEIKVAIDAFKDDLNTIIEKLERKL